MTNETTPDAVERQYQDSDGNPCDLVTLCRREPEWAASRLAFERDIITSLRDQLRKVEGERDALAVRMDLPASQLLMVGSELCGDGKIDPNDHRDPRWTPTLQQAAKVMRELTSLRALLPDVRACAEWMRDELIEGHELQTLGCRILAALDSQGGEGE